MSTDTYALLWSRRSNSFHVERLADTAKAGMRFFQGNRGNDYLLIAYGSREEVQALADQHRPVLVEREEVRRLYSDGA